MIGQGCCQGERVTGLRYKTSRHPKKASRQASLEYISYLLRMRIMGWALTWPPNAASTPSLASRHLDDSLTSGVLATGRLIPRLGNSATEAGRCESPRRARPCPTLPNKHYDGRRYCGTELQIGIEVQGFHCASYCTMKQSFEHI